ncbi:MAG: hypothetical protein JSS49_17470 [Planctomycetes bacterium]|nr:hypothetical protein [Planctomycetota bacterium]
MRFETSKSVPPHLNRRLQLRMLGFVGLIGVIMFVMSSFQANQVQNGKGKLPPATPDEDVFRVREQDETLKPGEFVSRPDEDPQDPANPAATPERWQEPPLGGNAPPEDPELNLARFDVQFDKKILRRVKDNTIGIRREEGEAYYRLLDHAQRVPVNELELAGATDVQYLNLMTDPQQFRGEPVTIHGDLWRLYEFQASVNAYGFNTLYEAWIFTADSSNHPYRVVLTELPRELEPGENLRKQVRVTGYFFKREGYASGGGMHVAPTLLAHRILLYRPPDSIPSTDAIVPYMIGLISAVGLAFLVTLASFAISDRRAARAALLRELNAPRPSFEGLDTGPIMSIQESLRQIEDKEWQAEADAVDESYSEVSTLLHARDQAHPPTPPEPSGPTDEELDERRRTGAQIIQAWTAQQHGTRPGDHAYPQLADESPGAESTGPEPQPVADSTTAGDGLSKLAAWETEIQQFASMANSRKEPVADQRAAQAEVQRDLVAREQEFNDRLQHERATLDHEREVQSARQQKPSNVHPASASIDDEGANQTASDHLTIDRAERHPDTHGELADTDVDGGDDDESDSSRQFGRRTGRHRHRRDGR